MKFLFYFFFLSTILITSTSFADLPWSHSVKISSTSGSCESVIAVSYPYVYAAYNDFPEKFVFSTNGGTIWSSEYGFGAGCFCDGSIYADDLSNIHLSGLNEANEICYFRSTNHGTTWSAPVFLNTQITNFSVDKDYMFNVKNRIYVAWMTANSSQIEVLIEIVKSHDRGLSFSPQVQVNDGNIYSFRQWAIPKEDPKDSNIVYVSMFWDTRNFNSSWNPIPPWQVFVAKSTNGGQSFLPNVALPDTCRIYEHPDMYVSSCMAVSPKYNDVYVVCVDTLRNVPKGKLNVFFSRSTNGGASFLPRIKIPKEPDPDTSYHFQPWIDCDVYGTIHVTWYDTRGYYATGNGGIKATYYTYSTDRGVTWSPDEQISSETDSYSGFIGHYAAFTTDSFRIYSTWAENTSSGVQVYYSWRYLPYIFGVQNNSGEIPTSFVLKQNYPNPFNPVTNIKYQIAKSSNVTLKIYDVLGKEVETLVNDRLKPGSYEVEWNADNYASGVYFYRLITNDFSETKKMILIK